MKPGWKTTEFWITIATSAWGMFSGMIPEPWNGVVAAVSGAVYTVARMLAKSGILGGTVGKDLSK